MAPDSTGAVRVVGPPASAERETAAFGRDRRIEDEIEAIDRRP